MKYITIIVLAAAMLVSCQPSDDEKADKMLATINGLYAKGAYRQVLDSITILRERYPMAVEARKKALVVWQNASLKMAQADVAKTDVQLQEVISSLRQATDRYERNRLSVRRDSLQARYDAMCAVVKMIHIRQKQTKE